MIKNLDLCDVWRLQHPVDKQYTWTKSSADHISFARLDRFYINRDWCNRILKACICPSGFSDHHLCMIVFNLQKTRCHSYYWHFNVKLLQDALFCEKFHLFWGKWRERKTDFDDVVHWWDVGKAHIRIFCQNYTANASHCFKKSVVELENEIKSIERSLFNQNGESSERLNEKKKALASLFHERAKGALIRARFLSLREMDAPSSFFFSFEKREGARKSMLHLKKSDGTVTTNPKEMRTMAIDFYTELFSDGPCDIGCMEDLFKELPKLTDAQRNQMDFEIDIDEITQAVNQLSSGRVPGIDGLPSEFYKQFWDLLKDDLFDVFKSSYKRKELPTSCKRAVLSLLPKKGDLGLLKNWRPVAILCTDYKILAKCLSNRLKMYLEHIVNDYQSYCIPNRTIMDNIFLVRDVIDIAKRGGDNIGIIAIDQEKAFDRVSHFYLFSSLKAFGFGDLFISWIKLLYSDVSTMLKVGGGLSQPVSVRRGIRQGCPLSGMLYSLAIEPLLRQLGKKFDGLLIENQKVKPRFSAYADDITVFIKNKRDVIVLEDVLKKYENASLAKVNWEKSKGFILGNWSEEEPPVLPGGVKWGKEGLKILGIYLGSDNYIKKNWEGMYDKMCERLSRWTWILPQLSFRGRVLVANNLAASALWHKLNVLNPPDEVVQLLQKKINDFFWSGQHWVKSAVLYLPVSEGGQGLIDIKSRIKAFRLQTAQKLLYSGQICWTDTACSLLRSMNMFKYDFNLFLISLKDIELTDSSPFYKAVLKVWKSVFQVRRDSNLEGWIGNEPLFNNPLIQADVLKLRSLQTSMARAECTCLSNLRNGNKWRSPQELCSLMGITSVRFMEKVMKDIFSALPSTYRQSINCCGEQEGEMTESFPKLQVSMIIDENPEKESILVFGIPELNLFEDISKKALYLSCVKVTHQSELKNCRESRWLEEFGQDSSPRRCWRSFYKSPIEKRTADLQWRIVHSAIATNRYLARVDPTVGKECVFCGQEETLKHLFLDCSRLKGLFQILKSWLRKLGEDIDEKMFVFGPKYVAAERKRISLINFLIGEAKLAIWITRKNKRKERGTTEPELILKAFVSARIKAEFAFFKLTKNVVAFSEFWGQAEALCVVDQEECLFFNL